MIGLALRRHAALAPGLRALCEEAPLRIRVPRAALRTNFSRSRGPGGQNVNKVNTKAEVRFNVREAAWLPDEVRERLFGLYGSRINREDELVVTSEATRKQGANLEDAIAKVQRMVDDACVEPKERKLREGISRQGKQARREFKRRRSEVKKNRRGGDDW